MNIGFWVIKWLGTGAKAETMQVWWRLVWQGDVLATLIKAQHKRVDGVTYGSFFGMTNMGTRTM